MKLSGWLVAGLFLLVAAPAFAQTGCVNSPENPTAVLGVVGGASAALVALRARLRRR